MTADKRTDASFTKEEIKSAHDMGNRTIDAIQDKSFPEARYHASMLVRLVGETRARSLLGKYASAVLQSRS